MKKSSKFLILSIIIFIIIIIFSIFVFKGNKKEINITKTEIKFNKVFSEYEGDIIGEYVVELLDKVIINAQDNKKNEDKLLDIVYFDEDGSQSTITSNVDNNNLNEISRLRTSIIINHYYNIQFENNDKTGIIEKIIIKY